MGVMSEMQRREYTTRLPGRTIDEVAGVFDAELNRIVYRRRGGQGKAARIPAERLLNAILWAFLELPAEEREAIADEYVPRFDQVMAGGDFVVQEAPREQPEAQKETPAERVDGGKYEIGYGAKVGKLKAVPVKKVPEKAPDSDDSGGKKGKRA